MLLSALFFAASLSFTNQAQDATEPSRVDDVVVSARPPEEQIRSFLEDIALPERNLNIARFYREFCVGAVNLNPAAARALVDRISLIGLQLGLTAGQPGCRPNILVIATDNGDALASGIIDERRSYFLPDGVGMARTRAQLEVFRNGGEPIRWWHVAVPMDARTGNRAARLGGETAPVVTGAASRLRTELRHDIDRVVVILDLSKLGDYSAQQIADYAAMVSFSQVDSGADFANYDSILAMMSNHQAASRMTQWDMDYLKALYAARLNQPAKLHQRRDIQGLMQRGMRRGSDER